MSNERQFETIANPAPLGLLGFGMTTILLNLHNAGIIPLSIVIVAMGFALGGAAQIIAGIMEFKKNNTFGATAFTAYGFFWWSLILIWIKPFEGIEAAGNFHTFHVYRNIKAQPWDSSGILISGCSVFYAGHR